jgi:hypothetical protein
MLREQLVKFTAAVDAEGPDWWRTQNANGGGPPAKPDGGKNKNKAKNPPKSEPAKVRNP